MWGRPREQNVMADFSGNTPTHVGKTNPQSFLLSLLWKHPHACGEDQRRAKAVHITTETPPRMWGRRNRRIQFDALIGNTPTHVGKTFTSIYYLFKRWKHPHACGEDAKVEPEIVSEPETPPRMWGRLILLFPND